MRGVALETPSPFFDRRSARDTIQLLRRLRLRGIWLTCLLRCVARDGRLIKASGHSRWQFLIAALRQFNQLLETMVPYRRDALLKALMSQRQQPYAKPHQLLTR